jgi:hypothetical protein
MNKNQTNNPDLFIEEYNIDNKLLYVVRDDKLFAGTKQRAVVDYVEKLLKINPNYTTLMYVAIWNGFGAVATAYAAYKLNLKCIIILSRNLIGSTKSVPDETIENYDVYNRAKILGADIKIVDDWKSGVSLANSIQNNDKCILWPPLGLNDNYYIDILINNIKKIKPKDLNPKDLFVAGGSGTLAKVFHEVFTETQIHVVPASTRELTIKILQKNTSKYPRINIVEKYNVKPTIVPYPTITKYDENTWHCAIENAQSGDLIWNVAGSALDIESYKTKNKSKTYKFVSSISQNLSIMRKTLIDIGYVQKKYKLSEHISKNYKKIYDITKRIYDFDDTKSFSKKNIPKLFLYITENHIERFLHNTKIQFYNNE